MYVCICFAVSEHEVDHVIADGARCEHEVAERTGAGTGCGSCVDRICDRLRRLDEADAAMRLPVAV